LLDTDRYLHETTSVMELADGLEDSRTDSELQDGL
jgi:hypothetical protein